MDLILVLILTIFLYQPAVEASPISNGFKFQTILSGTKFKQTPYGSMFAKIPQESPPVSLNNGLADSYFAFNSDLAIGTTNQIAKVAYPIETNASPPRPRCHTEGYVSVPIFQQPYRNYELLVVTAPRMKIEGNRPTVIYIVIPEEYAGQGDNKRIPEIYFVNQYGKKLEETTQPEPVLIIDNNRTITGVKSKGIKKYLVFKRNQ